MAQGQINSAFGNFFLVLFLLYAVLHCFETFFLLTSGGSISNKILWTLCSCWTNNCAFSCSLEIPLHVNVKMFLLWSVIGEIYFFLYISVEHRFMLDMYNHFWYIQKRLVRIIHSLLKLNPQSGNYLWFKLKKVTFLHWIR